jgi:NAD(P)-dependent dehydrogenase (short-subunit alcohol dehydrogenase family)
MRRLTAIYRSPKKAAFRQRRLDLAGVLAGKTALVTGASGGFGGHFARLLAAHGARVALAARRLDALEALKADIEAEGGAAFAIGMDVTDEASIVQGIAAIEAGFGTIDVLVNNSGVSGSSPALDCTADNWDQVFDTNLRGAFLVAREVGRAMRAAGQPGSIVNVASIVGLRPAGGLSAYAASKAGLIHLTHALGLELARHGIRVNAIAPGYYPTDMNADFWETEGGQAMIKRIPMRRLGELRDLDGPLLLLASDASRYMTGAVIPVDGGHLCSAL